MTYESISDLCDSGRTRSVLHLLTNQKRAEAADLEIKKFPKGDDVGLIGIVSLAAVFERLWHDQSDIRTRHFIN